MVPRLPRAEPWRVGATATGPAGACSPTSLCRLRWCFSSRLAGSASTSLKPKSQWFSACRSTGFRKKLLRWHNYKMLRQPGPTADPLPVGNNLMGRRAGHVLFRLPGGVRLCAHGIQGRARLSPPLATLFLPGMILVPNFLTIFALHLLNTYAGVIPGLVGVLRGLAAVLRDDTQGTGRSGRARRGECIPDILGASRRPWPGPRWPLSRAISFPASWNDFRGRCSSCSRCILHDPATRPCHVAGRLYIGIRQVPRRAPWWPRGPGADPVCRTAAVHCAKRRDHGAA